MFNTNQIQMNKDLLQVELLDRVQNSIENQIPYLLESCFEIPFMNYSKTYVL